jgi:hypothetical protein
VAYIDQHKEEFGVQPICAALEGTDAEIAPSTYYAATSRPEAARSVQDRSLTEEIRVIHEENSRSRTVAAPRSEAVPSFRGAPRTVSTRSAVVGELPCG